MVREIPLQNGMVALVDDEDYPRVAQYHWIAANTAKRGSRAKWYVLRSIRVDGKTFTIYLHRFIMGVPDGVTVDHEDGDGLNNQQSNLRMASSRQQAQNRGKRRDGSNPFKGVHRTRDQAHWYVYIQHDGKRKYLGSFRTAKEGARVFDAAARLLHGEFAWTNFPEVDAKATAYVAGLFGGTIEPIRQRPRALLTTAQVDELRSEYAAGGVTQRELADKYGVHFTTVNRIIRKNRYATDVADEIGEGLAA